MSNDNDVCCLLCYKTRDDIKYRPLISPRTIRMELFCDLLVPRIPPDPLAFPYKFDVEEVCELCQDCAPLVVTLEETRNQIALLGEQVGEKIKEIQNTMLQSTYYAPRNERGQEIVKIREEILALIDDNKSQDASQRKIFLSDVFEEKIKKEIENGGNPYSFGPDEYFIDYKNPYRHVEPEPEIEPDEIDPNPEYLSGFVEQDGDHFCIIPLSQKRLPRRPKSRKMPRIKRKRESSPETNVKSVKRVKTKPKTVEPNQESPPSDPDEETQSEMGEDNDWTPPKTENEADSNPSDEGVVEDDPGTPRPHKCTFCTKAFTTVSYLDRHIKRDHDISCPVTSCSSKFATMEARDAHLNLNHPDVSLDEKLDPFQCPICSTKCRKATLAVHMVLRHENGERKFSCDKCPKSYCLAENYTRHLKLHKLDGIKPFICDVCDSRFADEARLSRHVATHKSKPAKCEQCGKSYSSKKALRRHMPIHRGTQKSARCPHCDATFSHTKSLKRHIARDHAINSTTADSHLCQLCGKSFYLAVDLKTHMDRHEGKFQVTCDTCGETLSDLTTLKSHRIKVHGEDAFVCEECGRTFTVLTALKRHKITHTGIKEFECQICQAQFVRKHDLLAHMRSHTDERPFPCPQCEQAFKVKHSLNIHIKRVHTPGYVAPTPHKCPHCGKQFHRRYLMEGHIRQVHTGARPFTCDQCGKSFAVKEKLAFHLRNVHHGNTKSRKGRG